MADGESPLGTMLDTPVDAPETEVAPATEIAPEAPEVQQEPAGTEPGFEQTEPREPQEQAKPAPNFGRDVARMIRELSDTNPDKAALLRQIKEAVFRDISYKGHFESPEAAQRARASFDAIGGEAGLQQLQESAEAVRHIDQQAAAGSPELIDAWAKDSPDGLVKAAPYALQKIEQLNPQAYNKMLAPHFIRALMSTGIGDAINHLEWYAGQLANDGLSREVAGLRQWLSQLQQHQQQYDQQQSDPRKSEFAEQQAQLAREQAQILDQKIRLAVHPDVERGVEAALKQYDTKGIFKDAARVEILQAIVGEIDRTLLNDKVYQSNLAALKQRGDIEAISKYIKASVDAVRGRAAREVWLRRAAPFQNIPRQPSPTQPRRSTSTTNGQTGGQTVAQFVPQKPNHNDIDWNRDPDRMLFINGKAFLKNGRLVTWRNGKAG